MDSFDLIHIGHGKCLSTLLQRRWSKSAHYNFFHGLDAGNALSQAFLSGGIDPASQRIDIRLNRDKPNLLSYEGFLYFGCAEDTAPHHRHLTLQRQAHIAQALKPLGDKVLMVLRDPLDWIASSHAQYVKYGGALPLQRYFEYFRRPLLDNLDLARSLEIWEGQDFRPVALAVEDYRDPARFWQSYEAQTGLPAPEEADDDALADNQTDQAALPARAAANELFDEVQRLIERQPPHLSNPERKAEQKVLVDAMAKVKQWGLRRAFETMDADALARFSDRLALADETSFRRLQLDPEAQRHLRRNYLAPLARFPAFAPHLDAYHRHLETIEEPA